MTAMIGNGAGRISRVVLWGLLGLLVWWGWGFSPVAAAEYQVTTDGGGTINYSCIDGAADLSGGVYTIGTAAELVVFTGIINQSVIPTTVEFKSGTGDAAASVIVTDLSSNGKLTTDIELNKAVNDVEATNWTHWGEASPPDGLAQWTPIGTASNRYRGSFDGADYTISGIYINEPAIDNQGLFGMTAAGSEIKNLTVSESYIRAKDYVGAIVGLHYGYMTACHNSGNIDGHSYVGGLAGQVSEPETYIINISACDNSGKVTGNGICVGGVVGLCEGTVSQSSNVGTITGTGANHGGVAGEAYYVIDCGNGGNVSGSSFVGGVAGMSFGTRCSGNSGTVVGGDHVGGVIGGVSTDNGWINNCYNSGIISGTEKVGGVTGNAKDILKNCFNTGAATGTINVGLVAGYAESTTVTNCYYDQVAVQPGIGNGIDDQPGKIEYKTSAAFSSGEVAWLLQNGQADQVWGQKLGAGGESQPVLKATDRVYGVTLMRGVGDIFERRFRSAADNTVVSTEGIKWKDAGGTVYTEVTGAADVTLYPWLAAAPTTLPTATAVYGTRLADIAFSGVSDPAGIWGWQGTPEERAQQLAVGTGAVTARLIASAAPGGIYDGPITPEITPRSLITDEVTINLPANAPYTGAAITPAITVSDSAAVITADDYTISYSNNLSPGMATVTITGKGNYEDTVTRKFTITARSLSATGVIISQPANAHYTGAAITPAITVSDSAAVITAADYTISYSNNVSPGTATVTITGKGNYQGIVTRTFIIGGGGGYIPPSMSGITVTPQAISFDPSGRLAVNIAGLPAGAVVFYSLDGITYNTTPPGIARAGEQMLYLKIRCSGYQDYITQTKVTVARHQVPVIPIIKATINRIEAIGYIDLLDRLPPRRGQVDIEIRYIYDPTHLLDGTPRISDTGVLSFNFRNALNSADDASGAAEQPAAALTQPDAAELETVATAARTATIELLVTMENYEDTIITVVVGEAAAFEGFLAVAADQQYYFYQLEALNYSYLATQVNPALAPARMYQHFKNNNCQVVAFEDAIKGYLDYPAMMTAYLRAQLAGEDFVLEQYCDSDAAVVYSVVLQRSILLIRMARSKSHKPSVTATIATILAAFHPAFHLQNCQLFKQPHLIDTRLCFQLLDGFFRVH